LIATEAKSGKAKYSKQAEPSLAEAKNLLFNQAVADQQDKKYRESALTLYDVYQLDKRDTLSLFNAASVAVADEKNYDLALKYYEELKNLGYTGKGKLYYATDKSTKEETAFRTKNERDLFLKTGSYENPREKAMDSKLGEIYKNYALILVNKGRFEEAKKAITDARAANPQDASLLMAEADLYLKNKDLENYKKIISQVVQKNPTDPNMFYNLGVISAQAKENADAEKYYKKAIELDPKYINAYLNLAVLKLDQDIPIVSEMNKLGNTPKENKRYDELKAKRQAIFKDAMPYLEKAVEIDPKNADAVKTLLNVYNYLEMTAEAKALKAKAQN
ncbi:MAG TPA: tetratricopeptide repeat protein, partial [Flavobacterium sp.]|nr:tetratricopeptide repeat protein [Flavobacterium sp.]